jgi:HEPN domain-containing protein
LILKAVLAAADIEFRRTHNLLKLFQLLGNAEISVPVEESILDTLNPFAVTLRYDQFDVSEPFYRQEALEAIRGLRAWVQERLDKLEQEHQP